MLFRKRPHDDVVRFHARHAVYMVMVFAVLLTAFFLLLTKQYRLNAAHEKKSLLSNFQEYVDDLDNLLARVTSRVEGMRIQGESDFMEIRLTAGMTPPLSYHYLKEGADRDRFHLDDYQDPITREQIGNLTGQGSLSHRDPDFYREIYMALALNSRFRTISKAIQDAAWIYYTSAKGFINIYPWVSSQAFRFSSELYTHGFYTLGTPERNPERKLFWTEVYVDEYGKGLMTTCAAPVYDRNRFLGTVAIDLTVDFLSGKVKKFKAERGIMFLVNERDQLLAHPTLITSHDKHTKTLIDALPEALRQAHASVVNVPNRGSMNINGYSVLRAEMRHAPWEAYYLEMQPSLWGLLLNRVGVGALILFAGLLILVIVIMTLTHRRYVVPAVKLVNFIMTRDQRGSTIDYQDVPQIWKPWFRTIEGTFRENDDLTQRIRKQNEELEKRVKERTAKLAESNEQLRVEIEERKQAEKEKQRLQNQLQRAQKMEAIGTLAGGVAHDLNNVLAGLVSYPQLLLMELEPDSPLRDPILTVQKSGERAAAIVQDLLTLARRGVAVTEVVNVNALITDYLKSPDFRELRANHPGTEILCELEEGLLNVRGSPVHLLKCIMNLVTNAAEAMPRGGSILLATKNLYMDQPVSGYDEIEEGDYITVTVTDSGTGISPEDLERIFEPFYTKKVMGRSGTGLGMPVVWGTVKDHNGYIDIQSTLGQGSTITLFFPATRERLENEGISLNLEDYRGHGELILIVDDVREQREIGTKMLQKLGYRAEAVSSGEEAVAYVQDQSPDLIVLDMIMEPGMDGLETYQKILALRPGQKAIIVSGFSETDRVRKAQKLGAGTYVKKPYLTEKIAGAVKGELER